MLHYTIGNPHRCIELVNDDDKLFFEEMSDVVPLKRQPRAARRGGTAPGPGELTLEQRRRAAVESPEVDR